ncbi:hypothetical protein PVAND_009501 [Polypedilum vanderplanki]|uniref:Uncharacterized protein n=1 Tax=Polypedilum vanderplanki TaxID=319348 RepID=A0A9J6CEA8_POLVA|nr:hypothetical protein PVAND_009501 [Polypedilum vanderplanki]
MKYYQIFVLVIALVFFDQTHSLFLHGQKSGNLTISGNFHHSLLKNHPWINPIETEEQVPDDYVSSVATTTEATTTTTTTEASTTQEPISTSSIIESTSQVPAITNEIVFTGNIDLNQVAVDAIGRHVKILEHIQRGISSRIDNHIRRLERFENHVQNHFNKAARGSVSVKGDFEFGVTGNE